MRLFRYLAFVIVASLSVATAQAQSLDAGAVGKHVEDNLSRVMRGCHWSLGAWRRKCC